MRSPVCFQSAVLWVTAAHLARWSGRIPVPEGEERGEGRGSHAHLVRQRAQWLSTTCVECGVYCKLSWCLDLQAVLNSLSQEWNHIHLWKEAEWGKAFLKYLPGWSFGRLLIYKNTSGNALSTHILKLLSGLVRELSPDCRFYWNELQNAADCWCVTVFSIRRIAGNLRLAWATR